MTYYNRQLSTGLARRCADLRSARTRARKWLRENGFSESHTARDPDNNRLVMVWRRKA